MNPDKRSEDASDDEASGRRAFLDSGVRAQIVEMIRDVILLCLLFKVLLIFALHNVPLNITSILILEDNRSFYT